MLIDKIHLDVIGIRKRLRIEGRPEFYATADVSRSGKTVYQPIERMYTYPPECIVYRWQYKGDDEIQRLLLSYPAARHQIVLLWRPWTQHQNDRDKHPTSRRRVQDAWKRMILPRFGKTGRLARLGIPIEIVDASRELYPRIDWPDV